MGESFRMDFVQTAEPLPFEYKQLSVVEGNFAYATAEGMTSALRDDVVEHGVTDKIIGRAYAVSREIGDMILARSDNTRTVFSLLDDSRHDARPLTIEYDPDLKSDGEHSGSNRYLKVGPSVASVSRMEQEVEESGVKLRNPDDYRLLKLLRVVSHESGHALLHGVSRVMARKSDGGATHQLTASATYLKDRPEAAFTGDWNADVFIREEQFAEGYAQMVLNSALDGLGYEGDDKDRLASLFKMRPDLHGEVGHNQLDHIGEAAGRNNLSTIIKEIPGHEQSYPGELGYTKPLSPDDILEQLQSLAAVAKADNIDLGYGPDHEPDWAGMVEQADQATDIAAHLESLQVARLEVLKALESRPDPARKRKLLSLIGGGILLKRFKV